MTQPLATSTPGARAPDSSANRGANNPAGPNPTGSTAAGSTPNVTKPTGPNSGGANSGSSTSGGANFGSSSPGKSGPGSSEAQAMVQDAKSVASETAKKVEREAAAAGEQVKHQAADAVQAVKQRTYEATERAKQSGRQYAEQKKKVAADEIGVFSGAIRKASSKLHEEQHDSIASYLDAAAEQLDRMRDSLQHKSVSQLLEDVSSLARRRPDLVYGGMFLAGLAAVRMLKASSTANSARNRMTPGSQMSSLSEPASGASRPSAYSPLSQSGAIHRDSGFPSPEPTSTPYSPGMGEIR